MDDGVISGSPREVVDALLQYARDIQASGEELRLDKCEAFCPALGMGLLDHPDVHDHVQVAPDGTRTLAGIPVVADGLVIYGVPIGSPGHAGDAYVEATLQREVDAQVSYMSRIRTKLQNVSLHCMYSLGRYCIARMDYIAQHCYPTNALSALRRFDVAALSFVATALGADPRQVFDSNGIVLQRLRLPARSGGGGIRSCADLSPAAFVGTAAQALHTSSTFAILRARLVRGVRVEIRARKIREAFVRLGPAFVKIGQALSTRRDVLPRALCEELARLQDEMPRSLSGEEAMRIIAADLGAPHDHLFGGLSASSEPVATASLGQVYRAVDRSTGRRVAVKVQRLDVEGLVALDAVALRIVAKLLGWTFGARTDLASVVDEVVGRISEELDYVREARAAERFARLYGSLAVVPRVVWSLSGSKVLTLEWVDGVKLETWSQNKSERAKNNLVERGVACTVTQFFEKGFYHGDPHPGNLLVTRNGDLCYLDFGNTGELRPSDRFALMTLLVHFVNRDAPGLARDFVNLGCIVVDRKPYPSGAPPPRELATALETTLARRRTTHRLNFAGVFEQVREALLQPKTKVAFRLPARFATIARALGALEGSVLAVDPTFRVVAAAYPYVARALVKDSSKDGRAALRHLLIETESGRVRWARLRALLPLQSPQPTKLFSFRETIAWVGAPTVAAIISDTLDFLESPAGFKTRARLFHDLYDLLDDDEDKDVVATPPACVVASLLEQLGLVIVVDAPDVWIPLLARIARSPLVFRFGLALPWWKIIRQLTPSDGGKYWVQLAISFFGIMFSFILYGLVMEYATSGGRKLHELSLIFVTSSLYTCTAYVGKTVRGEQPTTVPTYKLFCVAMLSMGSTFFSVRSLRYVIFPVQVLAKSCKPIPVMIMGAVLGKRYPMKKYINVLVITIGVALFMGGGSSGGRKRGDDDSSGNTMMLVGCFMLFISLSFDGACGAYEDKIMANDHVGPFELMFNIQLGKTILAFMGLVFLNEIDYFFQMCAETGPVLLVLGLTGAAGQVFIFVTIAQFGALMCSLIGLARKITTLVASIIVYSHPLSLEQAAGLVLAVGAMIYNFMDKGKKKNTSSSSSAPRVDQRDVEMAKVKELKPLIADDGKPTAEEEDDDDEFGGGGGGEEEEEEEEADPVVVTAATPPARQ
ncbi:hypothetical protein CTAYLR_008498 [Chrysophaeum taylorii]|uniref:Protein kinase domain-containing protein n=1 Tax=Chrysophaeum taylorii TaxID=2483200 RepID=A0AAD7UBX3_9STRA|nr:hypothetical protein CTAYLR_008498 [Chrysophaeum taylorii]